MEVRLFSMPHRNVRRQSSEGVEANAWGNGLGFLASGPGPRRPRLK